MKDFSILFYDTQALHVLKNPSYPSGGSVRQTFAWKEGLRTIGVKTIIMGAHNDREYFNKFDDVIVTYNPDKGIRMMRYAYLRTPKLIQALYRSNAKYVYFGVPGHIAGLLAILSTILRKKFILRIASNNLISINNNKNRDLFRSVFFRIGFVFSDYIICQNSYQYDRLRKKYPDKTYKLRNPYLGKVAESIVSLKERKHIAWIGRFSYAKNLPLLYKIVKSLPDYTFKIAGDTETYYNSDNYYIISELQKLPNVSFVGYLKREEILLLLRESYFLLNTSHYEGFSNTFLEAFSVGTPVFAMNQADPDSIIKKYKLGYIYRDVSDIVSVCRVLLERGREYEAIASNCIQYMNENHNLIRQSYEFLDIIR